jgi:hypothetical protein
MAGGDLLYIFAFIILPTAVLVSCIWALIMLRKGVLLPERRAVARDWRVDSDTEEDVPLDEPNLAEETGEHVVIEPAMPIRTPVTAASPAASVADGSSVSSPAASADAVVAPVAPNEPPAVEQTQELAVLSMDAEPVADAQQGATIAPAEAAALAPVDAPDDAEPAPPDAEAPDLLMVPLDVAPGGSRPERIEPTTSAAEQPQGPPATATTPRRPPRRVVQRRPTEAEPSRPRPRAGQRRGAQRSEE